MRHKKPENWLAAVTEQSHGIAEERVLDHREQASEALLMGLRLTEGVDLADISARFGVPIPDLVVAERLALYNSLGLVAASGNRLIVSPAGMPLLDALLGELVPAALVEA